MNLAYLCTPTLVQVHVSQAGYYYNLIAFEDIFLVRGSLGLGNDEISLQWFLKWTLTINGLCLNHIKEL